MGDNKRWSAADFAALAWVVLHLCTSVHAFMYRSYQSYTSWTWVLLGVWLLGLLALDVWLYAAGRPGLLRFAKWYWAFSAALAAGWLLVPTLDYVFLNWAMFFGMIIGLLTPLYQLLAFTWLFFEELAELKIINQFFNVKWLVILLFCLIHFIYFTWLHRRAVKKGVSPDGPVDP